MKVRLSTDGSHISLLANGWYVVDKKTISSDGSTYKVLALIPVKWDYYIQNKYLQNTFIAVDNIQDAYQINLQRDKILIKGIDGNTLFYLHKTDTKFIPHSNTFALWLEFLLLFWYYYLFMHSQIFMLKKMVYGLVFLFCYFSC